MNRTAMIAALLVALASSLTACDKPTVNVGTTPTVVAGPAGPAGMDGKEIGRASCRERVSLVV